MSQKNKNGKLTEETPGTSIVNIHNDLGKKEWKDIGKVKKNKCSRKVLNINGKKFGKLTVIGFDGIKNRGRAYWFCFCECNMDKILSLRSDSLVGGLTKSCGCFNIERSKEENTIHGKNNTNIYRIWNSMKNRCLGKNCHAYKYYGGRGIKVCQRWLSFKNFYEDMGEKPEYKSLDRINNNLHYSCGKCEECIKNEWQFNCRWATRQEQGNNRRNTRIVTFKNKTQTLHDWSKELNIPRVVLHNRLYHNWSVERAFTEPY